MDLSAINPDSGLFLLLGSSIVIGALSSLHCIGMCGPLVLSASNNVRNGNMKYQVGRLSGYSILGILGAVLGQNIKALLGDLSPYFAVLVGVFIIFLGIQIWIKDKVDLPLLKYIPIEKFWLKGMKFANHSPFLVGGFSVFLPCGVLYGVLFATLGLSHWSMGLIAIFGFWLGTLPGMLFAPNLVSKILIPIKKNIPGITSITLVTLGILTIVYKSSLNINSIIEACH